MISVTAVAPRPLWRDIYEILFSANTLEVSSSKPYNTTNILISSLMLCSTIFLCYNLIALMYTQLSYRQVLSQRNGGMI